MSYEFGLHLEQCGIVSQLMPPRTPQRNGMSEHLNHTLLDMVRSMMSLTDFPLSFWGYAIETAALTLNMRRQNPLRQHRMNCGLSINLSCHFLKFGDAMLMSKGFGPISSKPNQRSASS